MKFIRPNARLPLLLLVVANGCGEKGDAAKKTQIPVTGTTTELTGMSQEPRRLPGLPIQVTVTEGPGVTPDFYEVALQAGDELGELSLTLTGTVGEAGRLNIAREFEPGKPADTLSGNSLTITMEGATFMAVGGVVHVDSSRADDFRLRFDVQLLRMGEHEDQNPDIQLRGASRGIAVLGCLVLGVTDEAGASGNGNAAVWHAGDESEFCQTYRSSWTVDE